MVVFLREIVEMVLVILPHQMKRQMVAHLIINLEIIFSQTKLGDVINYMLEI